MYIYVHAHNFLSFTQINLFILILSFVEIFLYNKPMGIF